MAQHGVNCAAAFSVIRLEGGEQTMQVDRIDHLVLTVKNISVSVDFYTKVMGMNKVTFGEGRVALTFGKQKINLHQQGSEFEPKAKNVKTGSADLCFIVKEPIESLIKDLTLMNVEVIEGPVNRTGATGKIISAYFRDPDGNLIEISNYVSM
jgi:catechol 2,3-dioxygenase-like lactoylglutathione lyase family enzyme